MIDTMGTESWIVLSFFPFGFRAAKTQPRCCWPWKLLPQGKHPFSKTEAGQ